MKKSLLLSASLATLGLSLFLVGFGSAQGNNNLNRSVLTIAGHLQKKNVNAADALIVRVARRYDLEELMGVFKTRKKDGLGLGAPPGIPPDGIEMALLALSRGGAPPALANNVPVLEEMGHVIAAMAKIAKVHAPNKDMGKKTKKAWNDWSDDMNKEAVNFVNTALAGNAQATKNAATKILDVCNNCHSVFK